MKTLVRLPQTTLSSSFRPVKVSRCSHQRFHASRSPFAEATTIRGTSTPSLREASIPSPTSPPPALSILPTTTLFRSYLISALSSSPLVLAPSLRFLSLLVRSTSPLLQHNRVLDFILKRTLYKHFCAGETPSEVQRMTADLKEIGYRGVMLAYAKEIVIEKGSPIGDREHDEATDVEEWKKGTLETIRLAHGDDFAALKFSGAGHSVLRQLVEASAPSAIMDQATTEVCDYASSRGVRLLFDAEQYAMQEGIDQWTVDLQRKYNRNGSAVVYTTYQAYLRSTPATLARHLAIALREGFTLGVKLVRGAYLASDPRHLIWATKEETDRAYDGIAESLMRKQWNDVLEQPGDPAEERPSKLPTVDLVLASHNQESVRKAISIRQEQSRTGEQPIRLAYGQLMGMADEVGCELIMSGQGTYGNEKPSVTERTPVYKYVVWGTVQECLAYLVRRAEENRDAMGRTKESRNALGKELRRRLLRY